MEEDEDDIYDTANTGQGAESYKRAVLSPTLKLERSPSENQDEDDEEGEEIEEDSDSDIDIITERKPTTIAENSHDSRIQAIKREESRSAPVEKPVGKLQPQSQLQSQFTKAENTAQETPQKPGYQYPEVHSSSVDVEHIPTYDRAGKLITEVDLDADLAEQDKPWRRPGSDQTDYFNYGFDEFTWTMYCLKQQNMRDTINAQKAESNKFEMMFSGIPSMPGLPGAMPLVPAGTGPNSQQVVQQQQSQTGQLGSQAPQGIPEMSPEIMNQMMQQMMASGVDPSQMDFGMFMQQFQAMQQPAMAPGIGQGSGPPNYGQIMETGPQNRNTSNFNRGGRQGRRW